MKSFLIYIIRVYKKFISPISTAVLGNACRFTPTCSQYTIEALEKYGAFKGTLMGIRRFLRCQPWGGMGFDPVPKK